MERVKVVSFTQELVMDPTVQLLFPLKKLVTLSCLKCLYPEQTLLHLGFLMTQ